MRITTSIRILGVFLMLFSFTMLPPAAVAYYFKDGTLLTFIQAFSFTFCFGLICWLLNRDAKKALKTRDAFLITVLFWSVLSLFGALPLLLFDAEHLSFTDALFESVSGFTTTGASVLGDGPQALPNAMRYYLQQLQFIGGMGIVVLAVAILPMLGVGGMQLYRTETPGPLKDSKLTPRIAQTAKTLWYIYVGLTLACAVAYALAGMSWFNAIGEAFSTVSTGGFSMHNDSFAYYNNTHIELIGALFMFLGGTNFTLHFLAFRSQSPLPYWRDTEFRTYAYLLAASILLVTYFLDYYSMFADTQTALIKATFNVTSLMTTTGLSSANFSLWPSFIPFFIMVLAIVGGCGGSTSGGMKVIRVLLLQKQVFREMRHLTHPHLIDTIKFGRSNLPDRLIQSMWAFIAAFIGLFIVLYLLLLACGLDITTAFGALVAAQANAGAGIGSIAEGFQHLPTAAKWIMMFGMLAGRLEIFTLLVLLTPTFWRR